MTKYLQYISTWAKHFFQVGIYLPVRNHVFSPRLLGFNRFGWLSDNETAMDIATYILNYLYSNVPILTSWGCIQVTLDVASNKDNFSSAWFRWCRSSAGISGEKWKSLGFSCILLYKCNSCLNFLTGHSALVVRENDERDPDSESSLTHCSPGNSPFRGLYAVVGEELLENDWTASLLRYPLPQIISSIKLDSDSNTRRMCSSLFNFVITYKTEIMPRWRYLVYVS